MKLTINDRIEVARILPLKSTMTEQIIARDIRNKIELGQPEMLSIGWKETAVPGGVQRTWDKKKAKPKEFVFTDAEITLLKKSVDDADKKGDISPMALELCEKIKSYDIEAKNKATKRRKK